MWVCCTNEWCTVQLIPSYFCKSIPHYKEIIKLVQRIRKLIVHVIMKDNPMDYVWTLGYSSTYDQLSHNHFLTNLPFTLYIQRAHIILYSSWPMAASIDCAKAFLAHTNSKQYWGTPWNYIKGVSVVARGLCSFCAKDVAGYRPSSLCRRSFRSWSSSSAEQKRNWFDCWW